MAATYSRFARAMIHPLYRKLLSYPYISNLKDGAIRALKWRPAALQSTPPRVARDHPTGLDYLIYTNASFNDLRKSGGMGALVYACATPFGPDGPISDVQFPPDSSDLLMAEFDNISMIFGLALTAVRWAIFSMRNRLMGKECDCIYR